MQNEYRPWVTYGLAGINILIFFIETVLGGSEDVRTALRFGALYVPYVVQRGQWYRLFTAMFVHFGIQHIASNMISLIAMGSIVEKMLGHVRFALLYLLSGIGGDLLALFLELHKGESNSISAGASGAICGLLSVFIVAAILGQRRLRRFESARADFTQGSITAQQMQDISLQLQKEAERIPQVPVRRVAIAVFLMLYPGLVDRSISMEAHLGGLLTGLAVSAVMIAVRSETQ